MKRPGEEWLELAKIDLRTIERIIDDPTLASAAAFHSQQCIEKSFKAILEARAGDVPRTHDLVLLYGKVTKSESIHIDEHILTMVNETYIETRYPTMSSDDEMNIPSL